MGKPVRPATRSASSVSDVSQADIQCNRMRESTAIEVRWWIGGRSGPHDRLEPVLMIDFNPGIQACAGR